MSPRLRLINSKWIGVLIKDDDHIMNAVSSRVTSKKENLDLKHSSGWSPRQKPLTWTQLPTVEFRSARRCCVGQLGRYPNSSGIQNIIDLHTGAHETHRPC